MFDNLPADHPLVQLQGKFDVVIVDAPMGMGGCTQCVSRLQSLWAARVMVRPHVSTHTQPTVAMRLQLFGKE